MFSRLTTDHLVSNAIRAVSDPALSPYSARTSAALKHTLDTLAETKRRHGPPPGFDTLRELSLSILVDFDAAETLREQTRSDAAADARRKAFAQAGVR